MSDLWNSKTWLVGCILIAGLFAWIQSGRSVGGHLSDSRCSQCHLSDQVTPDRAKSLLASQEKLCVSCHPKAIQLSHPSGFFPNRLLPQTFPLDWKGELTCSSCHEIHGKKPGLMRSMARGGAFCHECHDDAFFNRMPDHGASMVASGHLDAREKQPAVNLDAYSLQCLGCHDEKGSNIPQVGLDGSGVMRHIGTSLSHPIGRLYANSISFGGYRPAANLPAVIVLPDGKIGCVSCHEGYSKKHGGLTVDNRGSALCLTCHDM